MRLSPKMKSEQKDAMNLLTIADIDRLLDEQIGDIDDIACYTNVQVPINGVQTTITLKITQEGESINPTVFGLPDGLGVGTKDAASVTQPTRGFHEVSITSSVFKTVYEGLQKKFREYIFLLQEEFFRILALSSMSSYFREAFYTYPFIDFHANDLECGKTTAMKAFAWSCFNGVIQTIPTPAVIYRKIHQSKGVLGLDELEDTLRNRENAGFIKGILDAAHTKGIPAERCDPNDPSKLQTFDAFGIKVFSRVGGIPNSIISRSIRIPMIQAPPRHKLKKLRGAYAFTTERDLMYNARIRFSAEVLQESKWVETNCGLSHRPADLFVPILTMAKMISKAEYDRILKWVKEFLQQRKGTYEDEWNQALVEVCMAHIGEDISQKVIRDEWVALLQLRDLLSGKEPRSATKRLEGLSLSRTDKRTDNHIHFFMDKDILYAWGLRYRIVEDNGENGSQLLLSSESPSENEKNEKNEFSLEGGAAHTRALIWLKDQPQGDFTMSMKDYNDYGTYLLRRGYIEKVGSSTYRRT